MGERWEMGDKGWERGGKWEIRNGRGTEICEIEDRWEKDGKWEIRDGKGLGNGR